MTTIQETLQDGMCRLTASVPSTREELDTAFLALSDAAALEMMDRAIYNWWYHTAPKQSKGLPVRQVFGTVAAPETLSSMMERAALAPSRNSGPSKQDAKDATAKLKQWMLDYLMTQPTPAEGEEPVEITATMKQTAMKYRTISRAGELRAAGYPSLVWAWNEEQDLSYNLGMLIRAVRLYKADMV